MLDNGASQAQSPICKLGGCSGMQSSSVELTPDAAPISEPTGAPSSPRQGGALRLMRAKWRWLLLATIALLLAAVLFISFKGRSRSVNNVALLPNRADPAHILRLKGTTEAVQSSAILAPLLEGQQISTLTITRLVPGGSRVKRGEVLAEFDRQAQIRDFLDKQADYDKLVNQVVGEQAKESAARAKDETELKQAEDSFHKAELEMQKAEIVSRIDAEKNQETLDETKATFEQLRRTFDLKRLAARAAIRILEIQRDRTRQTMEHAGQNANLMQIHSPIDGVVVLNTIWKQGTMGEAQEGDHVEAGVAFMQVVDPSAMQVRVFANQEDFQSLQVGQSAEVRLDAYPDLVFSARQDLQAPIAQGDYFSDKVRTFVVIFSIRGNDPKLMPDLSAAVDLDLTTTVGFRSGS